MKVHITGSFSVHGVNRLSEQIQREGRHTFRLHHCGTRLEFVFTLPGKQN